MVPSVISIAMNPTTTGAAAATDGPGAEIVQLYVGFPQDGVERPVRLLRGFEKLTLQPGESFSCVGCHEQKNSTYIEHSLVTMALKRKPQRIEPFFAEGDEPDVVVSATKAYRDWDPR